MRVTTFITTLALALMILPSSANADWFVAPYAGGQFAAGSRANNFLIPAVESDRWNIGAAGGWTKGWWGVDADLGYHPGFFDDGGGFLTEASLLTLMGNARVALPARARLRPFASAGVGVMQPNIAEPGGLARVDATKFAWNAGGGVVTMLTDRVGIRADVRYFRATDDAGSMNAFGIKFDGFDFVKTTVGVAFSW
jgi:opacity protein-like surface antigen